MKRLTESQQLLGDAEWTLREFLYWPTTHHYTLGVLWSAAASLYDQTGEYMPYAIGRPIFTSELGDTGKSLSMRMLCAMVPGGEMVLNPTTQGMQLVLNNGGCPGLDEVDKKLGLRAARNQDMMAGILGGYTKGAHVIQQRNDKVDRINVHGPMLMTANNANMILHHDNFHPLRTRGHIFLLESCPEDVYLTDFTPEIHDARLESIRARFRQWGTANWAGILAKPIDELGIDPRIRNRQKEIWTILFRVAHYVGGDWVNRCEAAARAFVLGVYDDKDAPVISSTEEMLWAVRATFKDDDEWLSTMDILDRLQSLPQRPKLLDEWTTYRASQNGLARVLAVFDIEHTKRQQDGERHWGYCQADLYEDGEVPSVQ